MIKELHLHQIGPAPDLQAEFGPRLNLVTGDNGLGKTFLLDACWYALTRTWADAKPFYPLPTVPKKDPPSIKYTIIGKTGKPASSEANYRFAEQSWKGTGKGSWKGKIARPPMPGLVIYARIDGGFSIWDPARNYWRDAKQVHERPAAYQFSKHQVWWGADEKVAGQNISICNGLVRDVEVWRLKKNRSSDLLQESLNLLSEPGAHQITIGESVRVGEDLQDIPTLIMPYGPVPVTQAAAGIRRVLALAYLLVWAWDEHLRAIDKQKDRPTDRVVVLFDEVEAHLHPKWQRTFLPSLLEVVKLLLKKGQAHALVDDALERSRPDATSLLESMRPASIQIIATTHAPLVLASLETRFDDSSDVLFLFDLKDRQVQLGPITWATRGDASAYLRSPSFGLQQARSREAEDAIEAAEKWMRNERDGLPAKLDSQTKIHDHLLEVLGEFDTFWPRWIVKREGPQ